MTASAAVAAAPFAALWPAELQALYRLVHGSESAAQPVTVLQLGAERTWVASGADPRQPAIVLSLALGHDKTARDFFRSAVPTPLELETAIASVEDEVHAAHRQLNARGDGRGQGDKPGGSGEPGGALASNAAASPWSVDAGLHALATLAGIAPGPVRQLPLDALERLFNRLAAVSEGRPAAHEGLQIGRAHV